jgi:ABC-type amino acid transport substrate-binding protein
MTKPGRTHGASPDGRAMTTSRADVSRRSFLKRSGATALGASAASLLAACGHTTQRSSNTSAGSSSGSNAGAGTLGDGKTLRVGMEVAYAPYNWQTSEASDHTIPIQGADGQYADGYDVQFAKVIASALGMEPVAVKTSFTSLISSLNKGRIDIILAGMTATDERRQAIDFSDPYFVGRFGLLVRGDSPYAGATSLSDLRGAAVLGQEDTLLDTVIDEIPDVKHLAPVDSVPSQLAQLAQGTCDAITYNTEGTSGILRSNPDLVATQFPEGKGFSQTIPVNAGIAKGQDAILRKINEAIATVLEEQRAKMFDAAVERQPA